MKAAEGYDFSNPLVAEAYQTAQNYDLNDVEGATAYLIEVHSKNKTEEELADFSLPKFALPEPGGLIDARTGYHLVLALQREQRAATYKTGDRQNVAEHMAKLNTTTVWIASKERPDLNLGKVSIMANFHDMLEAYARDTVITNEEDLATKPFREHAAMTLLRRDLGGSPLIEILEEYEQLASPEARFVNAMDKVEAYQFALSNKARLHRDRWESFPEIVRAALPKAVIDPTAFGLMQDVMKQMGRKWHDWDCMPFDGDPDAIVDFFARQVEAEYGVLDELAKSATPAKVYQFTGETRAAEDYQQRIINLDTAKQAGNIVLMTDWLTKRGKPPTPPTASAMEVGQLATVSAIA